LIAIEILGNSNFINCQYAKIEKPGEDQSALRVGILHFQTAGVIKRYQVLKKKGAMKNRLNEF